MINLFWQKNLSLTIFACLIISHNLYCSGASIDSAGKGFIVRVVNKTDSVATLTMDNQTIKIAPKETLGTFNSTIEKIVTMFPLAAIEMKTHLSEYTDKDPAYLAQYGITRNKGKTYDSDPTGVQYNSSLENPPIISGYSKTPINGFFGEGVTILGPMFGKGMARIVTTAPGSNSSNQSPGIDFFKNSPEGVTLSFYVYSQDETDFSLLLLNTEQEYIKINLSSKQDAKSSISKVLGKTETQLTISENSRALLAGKFVKVWISLTKNSLLVGTEKEGRNLILLCQDDFSKFGQFGLITTAQPIFLTNITLKKPLKMIFGGQAYVSWSSSDQSPRILSLREKGFSAIKIEALSNGSLILGSENKSISLTLAPDKQSITLTTKPTPTQGITKTISLKPGQQNFILNIRDSTLSIGTSQDNFQYQLICQIDDPILSGIHSFDFSGATCAKVSLVNYGQWLSIEDANISRNISTATLEIKKWFEYKISQVDQAVTVTDTTSNKSFVLEKCPQQGAIYPFELVIERDGTPTVSLYNSTVNPQRYAYGLAGATLRVAELYSQTYAANMTSEKQDELKVDVAVTLQAIGVLLGGAGIGAAAAAMEALNKEGFRNSKDSFVYKEKFQQKNFDQTTSKNLASEKTTVASSLDKLSTIKYVKTEDLEYACNLIEQLLSCITDERSLGTTNSTLTKNTLIANLDKMVAYGCKGLLKGTKSTKANKVTFGPANHDALIDMLIDTITKILSNQFLLNFDSPTDFNFAKTIYQQLCKCTEFKFIKFIFANGNLKDSDKIISAQSAALVDEKKAIALQEATTLSVEDIKDQTPPELLLSDSRGWQLSTGLNFDSSHEVSKKVISQQLPGSSSANYQEMANELSVEFNLTTGGGSFSIGFVQHENGKSFGPLKPGDPITMVVLKEDLLGVTISKDGEFVITDNHLQAPDTDSRPSAAISKRYVIKFKDGQVELFLIDEETTKKLLSYKEQYFQPSGIIEVVFLISGQASISNISINCTRVVIKELNKKFDTNSDQNKTVVKPGPNVDFYKGAKAKFDAIVALSEDTRSELSKFDDIADNKILSATGMGLLQQGQGLQSYGTIDDAANELEWGAFDWSAKDASNYSRKSEEQKASSEKTKAAELEAQKQSRKPIQSLEKPKIEDPSPNKGQLTGQEARQQALGVAGIEGDIAELKSWYKDISNEGGDRWNSKVKVKVLDEHGNPKKDAQGNDIEEEKHVIANAFKTGKSTLGQSKNFFTAQATAVAAQAGGALNSLKGKDFKKLGKEIGQLKNKTAEIEEEVDNDDPETKADQPKKKVKVTVSMAQAKARGVKNAHEEGSKMSAQDKAMLVMKALTGVMEAGKDNVNQDEKKEAEEMQKASKDLSQAAGIN